jgi:hypothetical protein
MTASSDVVGERWPRHLGRQRRRYGNRRSLVVVRVGRRSRRTVQRAAVTAALVQGSVLSAATACLPVWLFAP